MGIFLSLLSAAIFGIDNYIDKFFLEKYDLSPTLLTIFGGFFALLAGLLIVILTGFYPIDVRSFFIIVSSGFLTCFYILPCYKALSYDETSQVIPLFQFYPLFVLVLSFIFLKEGLLFLQYIGAFFIVCGGFLLSVEKLDGKMLRLRKSFFYILLSSFIFAVAQVLYKLGVQEVPFWNTLPYEALGIFVGAAVIGAYKKNFIQFINETKKMKKKIILFMSIEQLAYLAARYTGYLAISLISVGLVSILAGFQPLFVLIFGIILSLWFPHIIKEVITKKTVSLKLVSTVLMIIGSYFIFSQ